MQVAVGFGIAAVAGAILYCANVDWFAKMPDTPYSHLAKATLHPLNDRQSFPAKNLWTTSGAVVMVVRRPG
jgi:hypothetical protein